MPAALRSLLLLLLISVPAFVPRPVQATDTARWGWDGHKIVCMIAWWEMEDTTREAVRDLLADDPEYDRIMEGCLWADAVRGRDSTYDRYSTAHYVNLPRGATAFDLDRDCAANLCVVEGIEEARATLERQSAGSKERLDALKFFVHFVGDIHQPMHAGYADDRGGNDTRVTAFGEPSNLHRVWDYVLLDQTGSSWIDFASTLWFDISDADRTSWNDPDPSNWAEESYRIVAQSAYDIGDDSAIGDAYYNRHIEVIEERLQMAGIRLAQALDVLFSD